MRVEILFYGFVRDIVDSSRLALDTPESLTVRNLIELLIKRFGERLRERLLTSSGELEANVQLFLGDQRASLQEPIRNGQSDFAEVKVFILSATAGG